MTLAPASGVFRRALPAALFVLLVVGVYADPLFFRRTFGGRDLQGYDLPIESAIHDAYARGRLPVWVSEISGGRPLLANPNAGALYPIRPLFALLPFPLAARLFPILHWALSGIGMILLMRSIGSSRAAAWLAAVTYVFSGVGVSEYIYRPHHPGVMLLPWILWALARRSEGRRGRILLLAVLFGLDLLAADVFTIAMALGATVLWIALEVETGRRGRIAQDVAVSLAMAVLLALPQIVATLLWVPETNRAVLGIPLKDVFLYSISPFRLLELIVPFPFGPTGSVETKRLWGNAIFQGRAVGFFASLYAGALPVIALVALRGSRPVGARFARTLLLAGLVLSVPGSLVPKRWGDAVSPFPLRYPEKFAVAIVFALAILAGLALDSFRRSRWAARWPLAVGALLALSAVAVLASPERAGRLAVSVTGTDPKYASAAAEILPLAFAEGGLLWMASVIALELLSRPRRWCLPVSLALLTLVPIAANRRIAQVFPEDLVLGATPFARFLQRNDPQGAFRTMGVAGYRPTSLLYVAHIATDPGHLEQAREGWSQFTQALWRRGTVFNIDFDAGDLSRFQSLRRVSFRAASYRDSQVFFGTLALRWEIRFRDQDPLPGYHRIHEDAMTEWDEHERAYPDIRLLESWREETGAVEALTAIPALKDGEVVVESGVRRAGRARPGRLRIIEKSPERLRIEAEALDPTWLFVLRGFWSHRTVEVDGRPAEDVPAQLAFSAVRIPAGRHRIEWREEVPGGRVSRWGPVLFALCAAALLASIRRKSGRA